MNKQLFVPVKHEIEPIIFNEAKVLILGSMPSVKSRNEGFYYMHPQNRFWLVLSKILKIDFINASIEEKKTMLINNKIALFDVIASCDIVGSKDSKITNVMPNPIDKLIANTNITNIFINGQKAFQLFKHYFPNLLEMAFLLPSTSPSNASYRLADLANSWQIITMYLQGVN